MNRVLVVMPCETNEAADVYLLAPDGVDCAEAQTTADKLMNAYAEAFDYECMGEYQPWGPLIAAGYTMADHVVTSEGW